MSTLKKTLGFILAELPHLSAGIIITKILIISYPRDFAMSAYIIGIFSAVAPDVDAVWMLLKNNYNSDSTHKFNSPFHSPLLVFATTSLIILFFAPKYWLIIQAGLLSHYLIDSLQSGEQSTGIQWLKPFNNNYYRFAKPRVINQTDIRKYVLSDQEWLRTIIFNPKNPEPWLNSFLFFISLTALII